MFVCQKANFNQSQKCSEISTGGLFCDLKKKQMLKFPFKRLSGRLSYKSRMCSSKKFLSLVVGIRFFIFGFMNSIDRSTHFITSWNAYTARIPLLKRRTFLYPLQHCVAYASPNFYTYIVYSTLKHVRNLLSIFFFSKSLEHFLLPFRYCHVTLTWTLHFFFVTKVLTCSVTSHSVVQSTQWNLKFVFNE